MDKLAEGENGLSPPHWSNTYEDDNQNLKHTMKGMEAGMKRRYQLSINAK